MVILDEKDKLISHATVEKVCGPYPGIPIVELEGCGHDLFKENVGGFVDLVEKLMSQSHTPVARIWLLSMEQKAGVIGSRFFHHSHVKHRSLLLLYY